MSSNSNAWLLEASGGDKFAVAEYELIEYVHAPELIELPLTPEYCSSILLWHERMVPVVNLGILMTEENPYMHSVCILAYQKKPGDVLNYIGVSLQEPPIKININDNQTANVQDIDHAVWRALSVSCYKEQEAVVPILGVQILDSASFRERIGSLLDEGSNKS